jgi:hypothetical protein
MKGEEVKPQRRKGAEGVINGNQREEKIIKTI